MGAIILARFSRYLAGGAIVADVPGASGASLNPSSVRGANVAPGTPITITLDAGAPGPIVVTVFYLPPAGSPLAAVAGDTLTLSPGIPATTTPAVATGYAQGGASYVTPPVATSDQTTRQRTDAAALMFAAAGRPDIVAQLAVDPPPPTPLPPVLYSLDLAVAVAAQNLRAGGSYGFTVTVAA